MLVRDFFEFSYDSSDTRISKDGCDLTRSDYPSDSERGAVCIY